MWDGIQRTASTRLYTVRADSGGYVRHTLSTTPQLADGTRYNNIVIIFSANFRGKDNSATPTIWWRAFPAFFVYEKHTGLNCIHFASLYCHRDGNNLSMAFFMCWILLAPKFIDILFWFAFNSLSKNLRTRTRSWVTTLDFRENLPIAVIRRMRLKARGILFKRLLKKCLCTWTVCYDNNNRFIKLFHFAFGYLLLYSFVVKLLDYLQERLRNKLFEVQNKKTTKQFWEYSSWFF